MALTDIFKGWIANLPKDTADYIEKQGFGVGGTERLQGYAANPQPTSSWRKPEGPSPFADQPSKTTDMTGRPTSLGAVPEGYPTGKVPYRSTGSRIGGAIKGGAGIAGGVAAASLVMDLLNGMANKPYPAPGATGIVEDLMGGYGGVEPKIGVGGSPIAAAASPATPAKPQGATKPASLPPPGVGPVPSPSSDDKGPGAATSPMAFATGTANPVAPSAEEIVKTAGQFGVQGADVALPERVGATYQGGYNPYDALFSEIADKYALAMRDMPTLKSGGANFGDVFSANKNLKALMALAQVLMPMTSFGHYGIAQMQNVTAQRGQDVTQRGQDITAATATRGQDLANIHHVLTNLATMRGQDMNLGVHGMEAEAMRPVHEAEVKLTNAKLNAVNMHPEEKRQFELQKEISDILYS